MLRPVLVALALGGAGPVKAEGGLNEARVPVADTTPQSLISAIPRALDQAFTKMSGQEPKRSSPERAAELAKAALLVQRYQYQMAPEGEQTLLWVSFDEASLAESAKRAGVKSWIGPRPAPLLWVALQTDGTDDMLGPASEDGLDQVLAEAAWRRGLPIRLPLMDLDDRMRVKPQGVRSGDVKMLAVASERYEAGPIVGVSVERKGNTAFYASWLLLDAGKKATWRSRGRSAGQALAAGIDELAERIAARHAVTSDSPADTIVIAVGGVRSGGDYGRLMDYLRKLDGVSRFGMLPRQEGRVRFRLDIKGGEESFRRIISAGSFLEPDGAESKYRMKP